MRPVSALFCTLALAAAANAGGFFFSKILVNPPPGTDNGYEAVEIQGPPNASLNGYWLIVIESDLAKPARGTIDQKVDLSAYSTGANGLLLIRDSDKVIEPAPDSDTSVVVHDFKPDLENGSNTFVLGYGTIADIGTDLDTDDDGDGTIDGDISQFHADDAVTYPTNGPAMNYADDFGGEYVYPKYQFERSALYRILTCDGNHQVRWAIGALDGEDSGPYTWIDDGGSTSGFDGFNLSDVEPHFGAKNATIGLVDTCGKCCTPSGECIETTQDNCYNFDGEYQGDGTTCESGCVYGACCRRDGMCELTTLGGCPEGSDEYRQIYLGDGTTCEEDCDAGDTRGACCFTDRDGQPYCQVHSEYHCTLFDGTYHGDGVECDDSDPCGITTGNCCLPTQGCIERMHRKDCEDAGGFWREDYDGAGGYTTCQPGTLDYACGGDCYLVPRGDSDGSGALDFGDIDCFVAALIGYHEWLDCGTHGGAYAYFCLNDMNADYVINFNDIDSFVDCLINGCP